MRGVVEGTRAVVNPTANVSDEDANEDFPGRKRVTVDAEGVEQVDGPCGMG
jgi:hypothetical protein